MKIIFALMLASMASVSFANKEAKMLGENASPEFKNCLEEDKCPSQLCRNSCSMMATQQSRGEIKAGTGAGKKDKTKASNQ